MNSSLFVLHSSLTNMTEKQQKIAASAFAKKWEGRGYEKGESQTFWTELLTEVRGRGLMVGAVLDIPHKEVRSKLIHEQHCFTGCASTNILRILPPLVLTKENVDDFIGRLETVLKEV